MPRSVIYLKPNFGKYTDPDRPYTVLHILTPSSARTLRRTLTVIKPTETAYDAALTFTTDRPPIRIIGPSEAVNGDVPKANRSIYALEAMPCSILSILYRAEKEAVVYRVVTTTLRVTTGRIRIYTGRNSRVDPTEPVVYLRPAMWRRRDAPRAVVCGAETRRRRTV